MKPSKSPSVFTLVNSILQKLKSHPEVYLTEIYRDELLSSAATLMQTIPEESRSSKSFKNAVTLFFVVGFNSNSCHREYAESFIKYLDPSFVDESVLRNRRVDFDEKHRWVSEKALLAFYEDKSKTDLSFRFMQDYKHHPHEWFSGLSEEKQNEILTARLEVAKKSLDISVISEIVKYSDNIQLWKQAADYVNDNQLWDSIFSSDECFEPDSDKGISLIPIAEHLRTDLWILRAISSDTLTKDTAYIANAKVEKIREYFGKVEAPQSEVMRLMAEALEVGDSWRLMYYSKFIPQTT